MNVLMWFKRDLRIEDHPALTRAAGLGRVLPLFIVEPGLWAGADHAARQWEHLAETLEGLRRDLAGIGAPLVVRVGEAVPVLERLARAHRIGWILSQDQASHPYAEARDGHVAGWAAAQGIRWEVLPPPPLGGDPLPAPVLTPVPGVEPGVIPSARSLRLADDPCPHRQPGGAEAARLMLEGFLARRGQDYRRAETSPLTAERGSSRLSPYLAQGVLSARQVTQATAERLALRPGPGWSASLSTFQTRLGWRAGALQAGVPLPPASATADAGALVAGETGLPFVDACLRYLRATGWLNQPARAFLASTAVHLLGLDWQVVGLHLARRFTDYDPAIHWAQMRGQAGLSARLPRLADPVQQGLALDPEGRFTRRWLPELGPVPDRHLHAPWRWAEAGRLLGHRYPEPVIDPATALRAARRRLAALRPDPPAPPRPALSRLDRARRQAICEVIAAPRPSLGGQLSLDL